MVALNAKVSIPADVLFNELSGEGVLLNLQNGKYYGLNEVGTRLWLLLSENGSLEAAYQALLAEYDVAEAQLRQDVVELVGRLVEQGLLVIEAQVTNGDT